MSAVLANAISLMLDMGDVIRSCTEADEHSELWTNDGGYIPDPRFARFQELVKRAPRLAELACYTTGDDSHLSHRALLELVVGRIQDDLRDETPANEIDRQYGHNSAAALQGDDPVHPQEEPMTDIPHAELIRAVLDGKTVQWRKANVRSDPRWSGYPFEESTTRELRLNAIDLMVNNPQDYQFRLKPEPVVSWLPVWPAGFTGESHRTKASLLRDSRNDEWQPGFKVLRIEFDPDTLEVISARTEAP